MKCRHNHSMVFGIPSLDIMWIWCYDCGALRNTKWKGWVKPQGTDRVLKRLTQVGGL